MQQTCTKLNQCPYQKDLGFVYRHHGQFGVAQAAGLLQQARDVGDLSKSERETAQLGTQTEEEQSWHWIQTSPKKMLP